MPNPAVILSEPPKGIAQAFALCIDIWIMGYHSFSFSLYVCFLLPSSSISSPKPKPKLAPKYPALYENEKPVPPNQSKPPKGQNIFCPTFSPACLRKFTSLLSTLSNWKAFTSTSTPTLSPSGIWARETPKHAHNNNSTTPGFLNIKAP